MSKPPSVNYDDTLTLFRRRVIRLNRTGLARLIRRRGLDVEVYKRANGSFEVVLPKVPDDALDAFLLNYRVLIQKNDRLSISSIADLLEMFPLPSADKERFGRMRDALNAHLEAKPLVSLECADTNRNFIDVMLYGLFAHSDPVKHGLANTWIAARGEEEVKLCFIVCLEKAMRHITNIGAAVGTICRSIRKAYPGDAANRAF